MVVPSPKTERAGELYRIIPLFKSLRSYLDEAWDAAPEGAEFIFLPEFRRGIYGHEGWKRANPRTTLSKMIRRSGVQHWPRLWHNLPASCEIDLAEVFPLGTAAKGLGTTPSITLRHYVDSTDAAYCQALE
ncbi:MAG: hypothetical protein RMJ16_06825 [Thermoguttaceae bacterium]|nr:hypothetical protein [Thermoguttaceae bacterium]